MSAERAHLALADGTVFTGYAYGAPSTAIGEAVFTTGMTGYQEVVTDPSYAGQLVCMTAPQIGNTGTNDEDDESEKPALAGLIVHELCGETQHWRANRSLDAYLRHHGIPALAGVDTRALTRHVRDHGAQSGAFGVEPVETLLERARAAPSMSGLDLTGRVTTSEAHRFTEGSGAWIVDEAAAGKRVVAIDYGVKRNILRCLVDLGCEVHVLPATSTAADVLALSPDGVFLSNGPGDPAAVGHGVETVRALIGKKPLFGICLGHQLLALALGAKTFKLKFGHRGLNHPVQDVTTGKVEITTQNHGFAVDRDSLPSGTEVTHVHLNDQTVQGIAHESGAFGVQYHPEAGPGPHDSRYLFRRFIERMSVDAG